jgi:hypothetical protein
MKTSDTIQDKIRTLADKYSLDNLGLDEPTYKKILAQEIKKNLSLLTNAKDFINPFLEKKI